MSFLSGKQLWLLDNQFIFGLFISRLNIFLTLLTTCLFTVIVWYWAATVLHWHLGIILVPLLLQPSFPSPSRCWCSARTQTHASTPFKRYNAGRELVETGHKLSSSLKELAPTDLALLHSNLVWGIGDLILNYQKWFLFTISDFIYQNNSMFLDRILWNLMFSRK